jgi:hypothetical protein
MKHWKMAVGIVAGVLMINGCGPDGGTLPEAEITSEAFSAMLSGKWELQKDGKGCIDTPQTNRSRRTTIEFEDDRLHQRTQKYSGTGCKDADLDLDITYSYTYTLPEKADTDENGTITHAFKLDMTYTGLKVRVGTINSLPSGTFYATAGMDGTGRLEFAESEEVEFAAQVESKRPVTFNTSDSFYYYKLK